MKTLLLLLAAAAVPTMQYEGLTVAGGGTVETVLAPIELEFENGVLNAAADVRAIEQSPVFQPYAFGGGAKAQYGDALAQKVGSTFKLGRPEVRPVKIVVPPGSGYRMKSMAVMDVQFVQRELFKQIPKMPGKLSLAVTRETVFYAEGDATVCCSWGTHGVDAATGNSFVLASFTKEQDVQPITQQLAEFILDPLHDPLVPVRGGKQPGNTVPAWMRRGSCAGTGIASNYFLLEPTDTNPKNNVPSSTAFRAGRYHLENVALPGWYLGKAGPHSFPAADALLSGPQPCPPRGGRGTSTPSAAPAIRADVANGHWLIGYWTGSIPLREVAPQWDVIIVAFAVPDHEAPEGTMRFRVPGGQTAETFKADVAYMKSLGRKVMISLGGGGQHFTLADAKRVPNFVASVEQIVSEYGFDGIDIDFESPSLSIEPGDTDLRHPKTPSIVNLISALRQLHDHFGEKFMISLVPEGTQIPAGYPSYGGQFGSYLPITYALRDILSFVDVQDYNTPPLMGLDGEIYQPGTVDYHAAMTELLLQGFRDFPGMPAEKVAVGFLTTDTSPEIVSEAMQYLITGKAPSGTRYKLRKKGGYPRLIGAMFWTIDADRRGNYLFSNVVGPQLHGY